MLFSRSRLLLGDEMLQRMQNVRVIIFGVGGVGSWCAESLVRSGITHLTIVDADVVNITNCNRQVLATSKTIGRDKVEVMKERLLEINPDADIVAIRETYSKETADSFHLERYDFVIDAIDSLKDKAHLIITATALSRRIADGELVGEGIAPKLTFFSSMGAALRIDPLKVRVAEFYKVKNDTLGRALRKKLKHLGVKPAVKFLCVYSEELPMENNGTLPPDDVCDYKAQINGSISHITGVFGFTLAGLVVQTLFEDNPSTVASCS